MELVIQATAGGENRAPSEYDEVSSSVKLIRKSRTPGRPCEIPDCGYFFSGILSNLYISGSLCVSNVDRATGKGKQRGN